MKKLTPGRNKAIEEKFTQKAKKVFLGGMAALALIGGLSAPVSANTSTTTTTNFSFSFYASRPVLSGNPRGRVSSMCALTNTNGLRVRTTVVNSNNTTSVATANSGSVGADGWVTATVNFSNGMCMAHDTPTVTGATRSGTVRGYGARRSGTTWGAQTVSTRAW